MDVLKAINPSVPSSGIWRGFSASVAPVTIGLPVGLYAVNEFAKNREGKITALYVASAIVVSAAITQSLKYTIQRDRPYVTYPGLIHPFEPQDFSPSFPSQHTSFAFATAMSLSLRYKKWWVVVPAFTWASCVGYSRLYLGAHYPSDVATGAAVGAGSALLSAWLSRKIWPPRKR